MIKKFLQGEFLEIFQDHFIMANYYGSESFIGLV